MGESLHLYPWSKTWIDPAVRVSKSADALRLGGLLATVGTHHIAGGTWTEAFFVEIQKLYERFDPSTPPGLRLEGAQDIPENDRELASAERFGPASFTDTSGSCRTRQRTTWICC